ncbi:MAG: hypothetical protein LBG27_08830 [Spirochaetaceae bacterium]|nr:hypothetical protein [Spirochaetaceae bacterium]
MEFRGKMSAWLQPRNYQAQRFALGLAGRGLASSRLSKPIPSHKVYELV